MDISVAPNNCASLNHMNRKQFYSALKLIAAHQSNLPLKPELLSTPLDLPLPRFTWALNSEASADLIQLSNSPKEQHISKRERNFAGNLAYEPIRLSSNLSDSDVPQALSHDATEALSTDSEMESETMSQSGSHGVSLCMNKNKIKGYFYFITWSWKKGPIWLLRAEEKSKCNPILV